MMFDGDFIRTRARLSESRAVGAPYQAKDFIRTRARLSDGLPKPRAAGLKSMQIGL